MVFTKERVALLITSVVAILFGVLLIVQYQASQATKQELAALKNDIWPTDIENPFREPSKYVTRELYKEVSNRAYGCEPALQSCKAGLEGLREAYTTTSRYFVMDKGTTLIEESTQNDINVLYRLDAIGMTGDPYASNKVLGSFPRGSHPGGDGGFSFERLANGLYKLGVSAEYMEAAEGTTAYIDSVGPRFLTISRSSQAPEITVHTAENQGAIGPHISKDDCVTSSKAIIEGISWNGSIEYRFAKPLEIKCFYSELGGINIIEFFAEEMIPARDLKSLSIPLKTGGKLNLQFRGADKPIFSLR